MKATSTARFIYFFVCTILLFLCISRGIAMPIQGDEAGTYIRHVTQGWQGFWDVSTANNHLLNTALVWLATLFAPFSEAAIRLPTLIISAWFFVWYVPARLTPSSWVARLIFAAVALMPYYFNEYLSMARGYGMASIFAVCALNELATYQHAKTAQVQLYLSSFFISLSCLASLTIFPLFILLNAYILRSLVWPMTRKTIETSNSSKPRFSWLYLMPLAITLALSIYTYASIKLSGVATIARGAKTIWEWIIGIPQAILTPLNGATLGGDFPRLIPSPYLEEVLGIALLALIAYQLFQIPKGYKGENPWLVGFILVMTSIGLIYLLSLVGSYPYGRAWVPYWLPLAYAALTPIFAITTSNTSSKGVIEIDSKLLLIGIGLSVIALTSSLIQFQPKFAYETRPFYYQYKSLMHHSRAGTIDCLAYKDINDEVIRFYYLNKEGPIQPLTQCPIGTDSPPGFMQFSHENKEPFFNRKGSVRYR